MRSGMGRIAVVVSLYAIYGAATAQNPASFSTVAGLCGKLENGFGPYDYRTIDAQPKHLVESAHFPPQVETLRSGMSARIGGDIDYTLRAIPNHHRALMAMVRLGERDRVTRPPGATYPVECYFDRAMRFAPDDPMVRVLYGIYLAKADRRNEAETQLVAAEKLGSENRQVVYNLGIGYLELKNYDKAVTFAKKGEAMGVEFPGLRERLQRAGKWPR